MGVVEVLAAGPRALARRNDALRPNGAPPQPNETCSNLTFEQNLTHPSRLWTPKLPTLRPGLRPEGVALRGSPADVGCGGMVPSRQRSLAIRHSRPPSPVRRGIIRRPCPFGPSCGTRLCAGRRLNALAIFALVSAGTRAPYSQSWTRLCARYPALPLPCTASTSAAPHIDNILSIGEIQAPSQKQSGYSHEGTGRYIVMLLTSTMSGKPLLDRF